MSVYKSRIGVEIVILFTLLSLFSLYVLFIIKMEGNLLFFVVTLFLFCPILLSILGIKATTYTVTKNILYIKSNFIFKEKISINEIKKIEGVTSIIKAPAASIKRLELFYGKYDSVMISPKYQDQFIQDLLAVNNSIEVKLKK